MPNTNTYINLESLFELNASFYNTDNEMFIIKSALLSIMGKFAIAKAIYAVAEINKNTINIFNAKSKEAQIVDIGHNLEDIESFKKYVIANSECEEHTFYLTSKNVMTSICYKANKNQEFTEEQSFYAKLVNSISANAIQNARDTKELLKGKSEVEKRNYYLNTLYEITNDFSSAINKEKILSLLANNLMGHLMITRFALLELSINNIEILANKYQLEFDKLYKQYNLKIIDFIDENKHNMNISFIKTIKNSQGKLLVLIVGNRLDSRSIDKPNEQFAEALFNIAVSALDKVRLIGEEIEKKKLENEMNMALEIQRKLLPSEFPVSRKYEVFGTSIPSRLVGGDYFDVIELGDNKVMIAIADVAGKGMPAAILMANLQSALRVLATTLDNPALIMEKLNNLLFKNTNSDKFVTMLLAVYNEGTGILRYSNAGHPSILLIKDNKEIEYLSERGLILGIMEDVTYTYHDTKLVGNDTIVLYTDGISEAADKFGREIDEEGIVKMINAMSSHGVVEICNDIVEKTVAYQSGNQLDDITILALKKLS